VIPTENSIAAIIEQQGLADSVAKTIQQRPVGDQMIMRGLGRPPL
jgi:hypothetical protein